MSAENCKDDVVMIAEHRLRGEQGKRTLDSHAHRQGWQALVSPARLRKTAATGEVATGSVPRSVWRQTVPERTADEEGGQGSVFLSLRVLAARVQELCGKPLSWLRHARCHRDVGVSWRRRRSWFLAWVRSGGRTGPRDNYLLKGAWGWLWLRCYTTAGETATLGLRSICRDPTGQMDRAEMKAGDEL